MFSNNLTFKGAVCVDLGVIQVAFGPHSTPVEYCETEPTLALDSCIVGFVVGQIGGVAAGAPFVEKDAIYHGIELEIGVDVGQHL